MRGLGFCPLQASYFFNRAALWLLQRPGSPALRTNSLRLLTPVKVQLQYQDSEELFGRWHTTRTCQTYVDLEAVTCTMALT